MGIKFTEKQEQAWNILTDRNKTRILFDGGSRSGKTVLLTEFLIARALKFPGSRQLIARKHRAHAKQSIWNDTLINYLVRHIPRRLWQRVESELNVGFYNGSNLLVGGLDDADRVEKILGNEFLTIFLNEATQLSWQTAQMVITRLAQNVSDLSGGRGVPKLLLDCNPRGPRHWLHFVGVRHLDPESGKPLIDAAHWAHLHWSAYDNLANLPPEYINSLEALPDLMKARMLNGIWRSSEGAVYDEFDENIHTVKPFSVPESWRRVRAVDFGFVNPFVCLWGALDEDDRLYLYREHYKSRLRTAQHAEIINRFSENEHYLFTVADHDAGDCADLQAAGIYPEKAKKNVLRGIQAVKQRLAVRPDGRPRLFIFKNLKHTLSEVYEYVWEPPREGLNLKEEPVKENDHAMDALRYLVMALDQQSRNRRVRVASTSRSDGRWNK